MYSDNPFEMLAAPMTYSKIRFHPTMKAKNSPIATYVKMYAEPDLGTRDENSA